MRKFRRLAAKPVRNILQQIARLPAAESVYGTVCKPVAIRFGTGKQAKRKLLFRGKGVGREVVQAGWELTAFANHVNQGNSNMTEGLKKE